MVQICSTYLDYTSTNVTTAAWVRLDLLDPSGSVLSPNTLPYDANRLIVSDSSGQEMRLGIGASGSQVEIQKICPNQSGPLDVIMNAGQSVWIRALSASAIVGNLSISYQKGRR